jgi:hypothetical protein
MTIRDQLFQAWRDLFPISLLPSIASTGGSDSRRPALWSKVKTFLGNVATCFYSLALVGNIAIPILAVALIWGLREKMVDWQTDVILNDRNARSLKVRRISNTEEERDALVSLVPKEKAPGRDRGLFDPAEAAWLREEMPQDRALSFQPTGVYGYREHSVTLDKAGELRRSAGTDKGFGVRSIAPDDPFLKSDAFLWRARSDADSPFDGEGMGQVIVHESVAPKLGVPLIPPTEEISLDMFNIPSLQNRTTNRDLAERTRIGFDAVEKLVVVGVYRGDMPAVMMTHRFVNEIKAGTWYPQPFHSNVLWGPLAPTFDFEGLQEASAGFLEAKGLVMKKVRSGEEQWIELVRHPDAGPMKQATWKSGVIKPLASIRPPNSPEPPDLRFPAAAVLSAQPSRVQFDTIILEVNDLQQLVTLAGIMEEMKLLIVDEGKVPAARRVLAQDRAWLGVQMIVIAITSFLSLVALGLALSQRIYQKTSEIGILRAFGASCGLIQLILFWQSLILWCLAVLICAVAAPPVFAYVTPIFIQMTDTSGGGAPVTEGLTLTSWQDWWDGARAFRWSSLWITSNFALMACLSVTYLASLIAANLAPARALKVR